MINSEEQTFSLEQSRDHWINAYYLGKVDILKLYEHAQFKVIFKKTGKSESLSTRYEQIQHAVTNGVWKPQKPAIEIEEFEYNIENTECHVSMKSVHNEVVIEEFWINEAGWKIIELKL